MHRWLILIPTLLCVLAFIYRCFDKSNFYKTSSVRDSKIMSTLDSVLGLSDISTVQAQS
jgi:hypothetical protein